MKNSIKISSIVLVVLVLFFGCNTAKKGSGYLSVDVEAKKSELKINLRSPINSADKQELLNFSYNDKSYFLVQNKEDQFKDNAPFIEYLEGGKRERLWFTSSRADTLYNKNENRTNFYQQIYFSEREIGEGKCTGEGWGKPERFIATTDNSMLTGFFDAFNQATKGAATIAGNTMIFSCSQLNAGAKNEFKQLWSVEQQDGLFGNPKPLLILSEGNTWESQPSLSANGKHLFFVSNRSVDSNDFSFKSDKTGGDINLYYSFKEKNQWSKPVLVKELYSEKNEITPHISLNGDKLYFSSDKNGDYEIYEADLSLDDIAGGYSLKKESLKPFNRPLIDVCSGDGENFELNGAFNQKYPCLYYNPLNKKTPQAFFWASDNPQGMGSYDIYGCAMPFRIDLAVKLIDKCIQGGNSTIELPVIELLGASNKKVEADTAHFALYSGLKYQLKGGSYACKEHGTYYCNRDEKYLFVGYSELINEANPEDKAMHQNVISGPVVNSQLTASFNFLPIANVLRDTIIYDTILIAKAWEKKPPCPGKLNIEPTYRSISYFQTGYWEVNTSENLKRDLEKLHEGFEISQTGDIYNPTGQITRNRSDYKAIGYDAPIFPVKPNDRYTYSIANAPWIELHPNNQYWGDRPGMEKRIEQRMAGRKDRINQYAEYAKKVDENLENLTDTIKDKYIYLLDLHKDMKPKLLIEIFAVSDQREVSRSWYIGEPVQYRGSEYNETTNDFITEMVNIIPPVVDEKTKTITQLKPCSVGLNKDGDNGSILGIVSEKTDQNTNLSRLRAWYGYKEVLKRLTTSEAFNSYLKAGKVALPDNNVSYIDADIIIITRGKREDGDVENPKYPYPVANNPTGNGYFDYDKIRHMEIQSRLLFAEEKEIEENYCCDPNGSVK